MKTEEEGRDRGGQGGKKGGWRAGRAGKAGEVIYGFATRDFPSA